MVSPAVFVTILFLVQRTSCCIIFTFLSDDYIIAVAQPILIN